MVPLLQRWEVLVAIVAGSWGFIHFLRQQHLEDAKFFRELFTDFAGRYDDLNDDLLKHLRQREALTDDQKQHFVDYFNLCAEEWLFYKAGYIYEPVWRAWNNGMKQFGRDPRIAELWWKERRTESYYEFDFPVISRVDTEDSG